MESNKTFYIKEVAEITGLSEQLIRKWESRYHIVKPERLDNGYRVYRTEDVTTLIELKKLRDQKVSMKQAIQTILDKQKNENMDAQSDLVASSPFVKQLIEVGTIYDEHQLLHFLQQANHHYGLEIFLQNTVRPFLHEVGNLWETGEWDESQESMSSLVVRDYLTEVDRNFQIDENAPQALGFCLPGERHEIPLQILLLQMKMRGWQTTRIGASPKFTAIERLIKHIRPEKVLLSASTMIPFQEAENLLEKLDLIAKKYPKVRFYIGGRGIWAYTEVVKPDHLIVGFTVDDVLASHREKMT